MLKSKVWNHSFKAYTFVEAIVGIALLSILSGILVFSYFSQKTLLDRMVSSVENLNEIQSLLDYLKTVTERVKPPYWVTERDYYQENDGGITLSYLDGEKDLQVRITVDSEGSITIAEKDGNLSFKAPRGSSLEAWKPKEAIAGLRLNFEWNNQTWGQNYLWGSFLL